LRKLNNDNTRKKTRVGHGGPSLMRTASVPCVVRGGTRLGDTSGAGWSQPKVGSSPENHGNERG